MKRIVSLSLVLGLAAILASGVAPVWAAECGPGSAPPKPVCECGDTVVDDYDFPANLTCGDTPLEPVDGLTVKAGVHVNLKGFKLRGTNQRGTGFLLEPGVGGSIQNGVIQAFNIGIKSSGPISGWTLGAPNGVTVTANKKGLELTAATSAIVASAVTSNLTDGVDLTGDDNTIMRTACSKNGRRGLSVKGNDNRLDTNRCERNGSDGIFVDGDDNVLLRNLSPKNAGSGVLVTGDRNSFVKNQATGNGADGVRGSGLDLSTDGRNYGTGNGATNCLIDGFTPTGGGRYC